MERKETRENIAWIDESKLGVSIKNIPKGPNNNEFDSLDEERNKNEHDPKTPNSHEE